MADIDNNFVLHGDWKGKTFWYFFVSQTLPKNIISTAVGAIVSWNNQLVVVHTSRGWDLPGGHIESGESLEEALRRELYEEIGVTSFDKIDLFGYLKIVNPDEKKINKATGVPYPKESLVPFYFVTTYKKPLGCQDGSCSEVRFCDVDDCPVEMSPAKDIIMLGNEIYKSFSQKKDSPTIV